METEPTSTNISEPTETQQEPTPKGDSAPYARIPSGTKNAPWSTGSVLHPVTIPCFQFGSKQVLLQGLKISGMLGQGPLQ